MRGRYSHVAAVMEGQVLLVAGGYSGVARGDLVAYKVPLFVSSDQGDRVSENAIKQKVQGDMSLERLESKSDGIKDDNIVFVALLGRCLC